MLSRKKMENEITKHTLNYTRAPKYFLEKYNCGTKNTLIKKKQRLSH